MNWTRVFWTAFAIGALCLAVGAYYVAWWAATPVAQAKEGASIGVVFVLIYGCPFWIGATLLARWKHESLPAWAGRWSVLLLIAALALLAATFLMPTDGT